MRYYFLVILLFRVGMMTAEINTFASLHEAAEAIKNYSDFTFPYTHLEADLSKNGIDSLKIFVYGSLVDYDSALRSISAETIKTSVPAIAFGARRTFNRDVPPEKIEHYGTPIDDRARGMLNVTITARSEDRVNGILYTVPVVELDKLRKREVDYDLVPVIATPWHGDGNPNEYVIAYTFSARKPEPVTNDTILPRPGYYELARNAAAAISPEFYVLWLNTTYLADGTSVCEWESAVQRALPFTRAHPQKTDKIP